jgi:hypothetical protein
MGDGTTANGSDSTAMGYLTTAGGTYSTAMGQSIKVNGAGSLGIGLNFGINERLNVGIDYISQNWSDFRIMVVKYLKLKTAIEYLLV